MYLIDANNNLVTAKLNEFKMMVHDENSELICMDDKDPANILTTTLATLRSLFENPALEALITDKDTQFTLYSEKHDVAMTFTGFDIHAWIKPLKGEKYVRLNSLFKTRTRQRRVIEHDEAKRNAKARATLTASQPKPDKTIYKVACGIKRDNNIADIEKFEGTQKEIRDFVNKLFSRNYVRTFGKCMTVFCINWKYDADLNDLGNWKTLAELTEEGVFKR